MADIFLSYAREDWERIKPLAEALEALGWTVWWDARMRAGLRFDVRIEAEIAAANCVVVAWSEDSVRSQWVRAEAAEAMDRYKLIPVFLDEVKAPLLFRHVHGLDLKGWSGSADQPSFRRLIEDISHLAGPPVEGHDDAARRRDGPEKLPPGSARDSVPAPGVRASDVSAPEMARIEPGTFLMGRPPGEMGTSSDEIPQHEVRIARPFAIGRYAVTFDEYDTFTKLTGRQPLGDRGWGRGRRPAINVSWKDAVAYALWLSETTGEHYRLPTEAEWEYAARAGTTTAWSFGGDEGDVDGYAWHAGNAGEQTHPVGGKAPNPWGLYDVHGNVWEWVQDCWHESYAAAPSHGVAWEADDEGDCGRRVVRGGSWGDIPVALRSATRSSSGPDFRFIYLGFRLAADL